MCVVRGAQCCSRVCFRISGLMKVYVLTYHLTAIRVLGGAIFPEPPEGGIDLVTNWQGAICVVVDCTGVSSLLILALFGRRQWIFRPNEKQLYLPFLVWLITTLDAEIAPSWLQSRPEILNLEVKFFAIRFVELKPKLRIRYVLSKRQSLFGTTFV